MEYRALRVWAGDDAGRRGTDFAHAGERRDGGVRDRMAGKPRDAGMNRMMEDPRMDPASAPMPFDGKRMIFGGFEPVVDIGA